MRTRDNIRLSGLQVRYGGVVALDDFTIDIASGEIIALLGPSGCGKSTALKAICGLQAPSAGEIWFGDRLMNHVSPHRRKVGMVFQNYALFPHKTVAENIAFGLAVTHVPRAERAARIDQVLELVQMMDRRDYYPNQLSGGQQQRVAIARSVAVSPNILLLDEPLSALDKQLREQMRHELTQLLRRLGITTVFVTHDQEEAFALADRVLVMHQGRVIQIGSPTEIYARPNSRFVADFLGSISYVHGWLTRTDAQFGIVDLGGGHHIRGRLVEPVAPDQPAAVGLRWSALQLLMADAAAAQPNALPLTVEERVLLGDRLEYRLRSRTGDEVRALTVTSVRGMHEVGAELRAVADPDDILLFPARTGDALP